MPNALPEPTAPQAQKTFNIAAAKEFDRAEDLLAAMLAQRVDANGFVYAAFGPKAQEMLRDALSRLSSLSTELVRVREQLRLANIDAALERLQNEELAESLEHEQAELVRVRGALDEANAMAQRLERVRLLHLGDLARVQKQLDEARATVRRAHNRDCICVVCEDDRAALGGLVPPDASPRRTE